MDRSYLDFEQDVIRNQLKISGKNSIVNEKAQIIRNQQFQKEIDGRLTQKLSKTKLKDLCTPLFPEQQPGSIVECMKLKTWNIISPTDQILDPLQHERIHLISPFPINDKINRKLALWVGDITSLDCQAIVHTTNENFKEDTPVTRRIYMKAGYEMYNHLKTYVVKCQTGDVQVTSGFGLNCRYCFHTVGPKYKEKYHTASEGALFSCYFKVLNAMRNYKVKTLALCPINTVRRGYPLQDAAHIGLRTLRRFLEKHFDSVERIIFVVDDLEIGIYEQILPLYFPRCANEEIFACYKLSHDIGGIDGEPFLPERAIRVVDRPTLRPNKYKRYFSEINYKDYNKQYNNHSGQDELYDIEQSIDLESGLDSSVIIGKTSFAKMKSDVDRKWLVENENALKNESSRKMIYDSLVRQAKITDHTEIMKLRWLYVNGVDRFGRSVIVIIGSFFKSTINLDRALLYFIYQIDRIKNREFTIVYFHDHLKSERNYVPINFFRHVYDTVDRSYITNLNAIYIVHPTIWFKLAFWWFTTFSATGLKNKVIFVKSLLDLDTIIELQHLKIPESILSVDFKINGNRYVAQDASEFFY